MPQKDRSELQGLFKTGDKPSERDFADFIESTLNIKDDGIERIERPDKDADAPLKITGNVGIDTESPDAKLHVNGNFKLRSGVAVNQISSDTTLQGNSDLTIPTEKAIKTYADTKALLAGSDSQDFTAKNLTVTEVLNVVGNDVHLPGHIQLKAFPNQNFAYLQARDDSFKQNISLVIRTQKYNLEKKERKLIDALRIDYNGNVGIGTESPDAKAKLQVNGDFKLQSGVAVNQISSDTTLQGNSDLTIPTEKAIKTYADTKALLAGSDSQDFNAKNLTVNGNLTVTGDVIAKDTEHQAGNVLLGDQDEDTVTIHGSLKSAHSSDFLKIDDALHLTERLKLAEGKEIFFTGNGQIRSADNNHRILFRRQENKLEFREYGDIIFSPGATSGTETAKVVFQSNGNVGIGTTAPNAKLEVNGSLKVQDVIQAPKGIQINGKTNHINTDGAFYRYQDGQVYLTVDDNLYIRDSGGNGDNKKFHFNTNGGHLDIHGSVGVKGNYYIHVDGRWQKLWHLQFKEEDFPSDINLKQKINPISDALINVSKLNPISFYWQNPSYFTKQVNDANLPSFLTEEDIEALKQEQEKLEAKFGEQQYGFIAQEIETVFPNWVSTGDDSYKRLNLTMLPPLIVAAIQELEKKYHDLVTENQNLNMRLRQLEER